MRKKYINWNFAGAVFGISILLNMNSFTKEHVIGYFISAAISGILCGTIVQYMENNK